MKRKCTEKNKVKSRRDALKKIGKTSAFVIPAVVSFKTAELKAQVSVVPVSKLPGEPGDPVCPSPSN